ncbi:growth-regulating factor 2 [Perilla frutescens var. hirtella]|nr:growth-regulating factor 2 [Perilla frutescens var. hirtella]
MHSQPLTTLAIAAPPPAGESGAGLVATDKKINLDLRIGSCACASEGGLKTIFTAAQFHDLCNQILVYNSIAYGFSVASHLFIPIWMSVFNSLGPAIYKTYPSFSGFSSANSDHSSVMDSEPGRCRRTDGRKWRCSKNVVPLQKYCERHMHRGRHRQGSRKHVEPIERVSRPNNRASDDSRMPVMSLVASDIDSRVSISVQSHIGPSQLHSSYRRGVPTILNCRNFEANDALLANCSTSGGDHADGKSTFVDVNPINISSRKQNVVGYHYVGFTSSRFGLSPKSVLNAAGKVGLGSGCTTIMEDEPQRCRRTDGKKWQCRRGALPDQKYCEAHMHRGAKRLMVNPESSRSFHAIPAWTAHSSCSITRNLESSINLNTVPTSPQHTMSNNSSSSTTSDATTITDENISFCFSNSPHNR